MRLPRWLLVSLLLASAVALVAVPAWLWVEMPRWTAERFVVAIESKDAAAANLLLSNSSCEFRSEEKWTLLCFDFQKGGGTVNAKAAIPNRSISDLICGRQPIHLQSGRGNTIPIR